MIFKNLDKSHLTAVMRLRLADMQPFMGLITIALDEQKGLLMKAADPMDVYRIQGKAQVLQDLLELVAGADKLYSKI